MELAIQDLRNHVIGCIEHVLVRCTPAARFRYHLESVPPPLGRAYARPSLAVRRPKLAVETSSSSAGLATRAMVKRFAVDAWIAGRPAAPGLWKTTVAAANDAEDARAEARAVISVAAGRAAR